MNRKLIGLTLVGAFLAVPVALKLGSRAPTHEAELARVGRQAIHPSILASGNLVFRQEVQLSSEVIGKVAQVLVKEGEAVLQGQVLLRLDPTTYRAEVAQQEANRRSAGIAIERAQLNLDNQQRIQERSRRLVQDKFIDVSKYEEAVHQVELARVDLRASRETLQQANALMSQAGERLARTEVRAPISGTATAVQIKIGETAIASATGMAGSSLMTIADVASMMAEVNVDEADIARVLRGQRARVFPSAFPDRPVDGKVESVSMTPKVSAQGRNYIVKLRLDDSTLALRSGMTCRVEIVVGSGSVGPVVPLQAVLAEESLVAKDSAKAVNYVFAVIDGKAKKKLVELGLADDDLQEVIRGLAVGETIVLGPARVLRALREGDQVKAHTPALIKAPAPALKVAAGSAP